MFVLSFVCHERLKKKKKRKNFHLSVKEKEKKLEAKDANDKNGKSSSLRMQERKEKEKKEQRTLPIKGKKNTVFWETGCAGRALQSRYHCQSKQCCYCSRGETFYQSFTGQRNVRFLFGILPVFSRSGFMCMTFYRRDGHVIEVQTGSAVSRPEEACSTPHFQQHNIPFLTLVSKYNSVVSISFFYPVDSFRIRVWPHLFFST